MAKSTVNITSKLIKYNEDKQKFIIDLGSGSKGYFYTHTDNLETKIKIDLKSGFSFVNTLDTLEPVLNKPLFELASLENPHEISSQIKLSIETVKYNKMMLCLQIINNSEHEISFSGLPYKILNMHDDILFESKLSDQTYAALPNTFSVYKINVEQEKGFNIPLNQYNIIFG